MADLKKIYDAIVAGSGDRREDLTEGGGKFAPAAGAPETSDFSVKPLQSRFC